MDKWKLINVTAIEWQQDESGYYCVINFVNVDEESEERIVRLDILTTSDQPAISFQGYAENVRKTAMKYAEANGWNMSLEHAAYIGYELHKAEEQGTQYIQD